MLMEMEAPSSTSSDPGRRFRDYLLALEDERRKIHVFQRELPLSLHLVTHTIEAMKSQIDRVLSSEETTVSDHGPVLEEFIPLNPSVSPSSSDEEESTHAVPPVSDAEPETDKAMPAWLQSVVHLRTEPHHQSPSHNNMELPYKPVALNATKPGGAFRPFDKENRPVAELPASSTTAAASSAVVGDRGDSSDTDQPEVHDRDSKATGDTEVIVVHEHDKDKEGQSQPNRKPRRCWAPELHRRFLQALQQLGGSHVATPKQIRESMKVDGLTNDEVKSHLQKYRLHTSRRTRSTTLSSGAATTQPARQFVLVGSCFWIPSHEYATVVAAAATATTSPPQVKLTNIAPKSVNQVDAPVAMLPARLKPHLQEQASRQSKDGKSDGTCDISSDTPTASSSSQTTSA